MALIEEMYLPLYFICTTGILANVLLLVALIKDPLKCFRNSATYLIANLSISDLCVSLCIMSNLLGQDPVLEFVTFVFFYSSMLTIFSIAFDRYLMIVHPFRHRVLISGKRVALWICLNWMLSSIHSIERLVFDVSRLDNVFKCSVAVVLILFTCCLYAKTYFTLRSQAKAVAKLSGFSEQEINCQSSAAQIQNPSNSQHKSSFQVRRAKEQKFLTTIIIIACLAVVTLLPPSVHRQVHRGAQMVLVKPKDKVIQAIVITIMSLNFAVNPFIYVLRLKRYRKTFKILYTCK